MSDAMTEAHSQPWDCGGGMPSMKTEEQMRFSKMTDNDDRRMGKTVVPDKSVHELGIVKEQDAGTNVI
jgi:hypothetical protein